MQDNDKNKKPEPGEEQVPPASNEHEQHEQVIDPGNEHHHSEADDHPGAPAIPPHEPGEGPNEEPDHSGEDG